MLNYSTTSQTMRYQTFGHGETLFLWAHGWGQRGAALEGLAKGLEFMGTHILVDFPGFGESPYPKNPWTIEDYARFMEGFLKIQKAKKIIWVSHSFGCRVGIKLESLFPGTLSQMVLIASPGLPRKRTLFEALKFHTKIRIFKFCKFFAFKESWLEILRGYFGSSDYKNAGPLRQTFMNVVREDLTKDIQKITCPTLFIYGAHDDATPPEMGHRLHGLLRESQIQILEGFNHLTILTQGVHQVSGLIKRFVE